MSTYNIQVRGEAVHIKFKRINDSRRLQSFDSHHKKPNLFGVRSAMVAEVTLPPALTPGWWHSQYPEQEITMRGAAFCTHQDKWVSSEGRRRALTDALQYIGHDKAINAEIIDTFLAAEKCRMKAKGPARIPRTRKPKERPSLRKILLQLQETLEQMNHPLIVGQDQTTDPIDWSMFTSPVSQAEQAPVNGK